MPPNDWGETESQVKVVQRVLRRLVATQVIPSPRTAGPHSQLWPDLKVIATEQGQAAACT